MARGKWLNELSVSTPLVDAARRVLSVRLEVVRDYLGLAVEQWEIDIEYVHQLRVGARRVRAALELFSSCLPQKKLKEAKKALRDLRRAAGAARDWDVLLEWLGKEAKSTQKSAACSGIDFLMGHAFAHRLHAQETLQQAVTDPFAFDRFYIDLVGAVRPADSKPKALIDLARPALAGLLQDLDRAGNDDPQDYELLHEVRIIGKQLRYAMEVFANCFPPEFRTVHYAAIEELQEILGRANDSHVAAGLLTQLSATVSARLPKQWQRFKSDFNRLLKFHEERLPTERAKFETWWKKWQETPNGRSGLLHLLNCEETEA